MLIGREIYFLIGCLNKGRVLKAQIRQPRPQEGIAVFSRYPVVRAEDVALAEAVAADARVQAAPWPRLFFDPEVYGIRCRQPNF